jgi:hypothetical protein
VYYVTLGGEIRNSFGIPSSPTAFPLARFFKEVSIDVRENLNENISVVGTKFSSNLATLFDDGKPNEFLKNGG